MNTDRQPKCAEIVESAWQSRREDLRLMLEPEADDLTIESHDPTDKNWQVCLNEYSVVWLTRDQLRDYAETAAGDDLGANINGNPKAWTEEGLAAVKELIWEDYQDKIRDCCSTAFAEYGLCFDYVAPHTFNDQPDGYWRYQISYGGPSQEIRFYGNIDGSLGRAEFWHLDWFDGAPFDVTTDPVARLVWDEFAELEMLESTMEAAQ